MTELELLCGLGDFEALRCSAECVEPDARIGWRYTIRKRARLTRWSMPGSVGRLRKARARQDMRLLEACDV